MRWATIGYHYDWTKKVISKLFEVSKNKLNEILIFKVYNENDFTPIPIDIEKISKLIATLTGFPEYKPEAGIINYYHLNSTLSGHQDFSEENKSAPLISISFGCSAIFLIGADTKSVKPSAICLRSGDILIMTAQSRLAFHGVPKIFKEDNLNSLFNYEKSDLYQKNDYYVHDDEWIPFFDYININRINLNIRQVHF